MEGIQKGDKGKVISFTTIHVTASDCKVPYDVVFVELENGIRVTGNFLEEHVQIDEIVRLSEVNQEGTFLFERLRGLNQAATVNP